VDFTYNYTIERLFTDKNQGFFDVITGSRKYIELLMSRSSAVMLKISFNDAVSGSANYKRTELLAITRGTAYTTEIVEYVQSDSLTGNSVGTIPAQTDVQVEIDSLGNGATSPISSNQYRKVIVSVPASADYLSFYYI
jgi:hypothetical protein